MLNQREMSDRLEIQALLTDYCHAIDQRDWDLLDDIFVPEAIIDYTEVGGEKGNVAEMKLYLGRALEKFSGFQHMISAPRLKITGDEATARTILFNPMVLDRQDGPHVFFVGLWYRDKLIRTPKGWRISERYEERSYFFNSPSDL